MTKENVDQKKSNTIILLTILILLLILLFGWYLLRNGFFSFNSRLSFFTEESTVASEPIELNQNEKDAALPDNLREKSLIYPESLIVKYTYNKSHPYTSKITMRTEDDLGTVFEWYKKQIAERDEWSLWIKETRSGDTGAWFDIRDKKLKISGKVIIMNSTLNGKEGIWIDFSASDATYLSPSERFLPD